jgi:hypothetical protein
MAESKKGKHERRMSNIVIPVASVAISAVISVVIASWANAEVRSQFEQTLAAQEESNQIMRESLLAQLASLEKKSFISVIIKPVDGIRQLTQVSATTLQGGNGTNEVQSIGYNVTKLGLVGNRTASFSIEVANVGSNIAWIDHIVATIAPLEQGDTLPIYTLERKPIEMTLSPDGLSYKFIYSFPVKPNFAPSGQIIFQVYLESENKSYNKEYSFEYDYFEK